MRTSDERGETREAGGMIITTVNTERMWISRLRKDAQKYGVICPDDVAAVQWGLLMSDADLLNLWSFGPKGVRWLRSLNIAPIAVDAFRPEFV